MNNRPLIYLLALSAFFAGTAELVIAGIVDLIAANFNVSLAVSGQLVTVFSLSLALGSPIAIALTSKMNRKSLLLTTLACLTIGNLLAMLSGHIFALMMISRIVLGISAGVSTVVSLAIAANLVESEKRGGAIANVQAGFSISLVIGVPAGVLVASHWGWHAIFGALALANILILLLMVKMLPQIPRNQNAPKTQLTILRNPRVIGGLVVTFLNVLGYSICYTYISPYLQTSAHFSLTAISGILLLMGVCGTIGVRLGGYGSDRWGVNKTLFTMLAIHAATLLLFPFLATTAIGAVTGIIVWGISAWSTVPTIFVYMMSLVPESAETAISVNTSIFQIGIALGAVIGGLIVSGLSFSELGWIGGITVALGLISAVLMLSPGKLKATFSKA